MEMKVLESVEGISHVALIGRLNAAGVSAVEQKFRMYVEGRTLPTIVDLSGVTDIASVGMRLLLASFKVLKENRMKMVLLKPQFLVEEALKTACLDQLLPILHEEREAFKRLLTK
jgi:anti-anti-sigma factor